MEATLFNPAAPKKPTNLSINSDLLRKARDLKINLSQLLEQKLAELLREQARRNWREDNAGAIEEYNSRIEANGVFSDELRRF